MIRTLIQCFPEHIRSFCQKPFETQTQRLIEDTVGISASFCQIIDSKDIIKPFMTFFHVSPATNGKGMPIASNQSMNKELMSSLLEHAESQLRSGNLEGAEQVCSEVLKKVPNNVEALFLLGNLAHQKGNCLDAVSYFTRAVAESPELPNSPYST